jgi:hypothetical protein
MKGVDRAYSSGLSWKNARVETLEYTSVAEETLTRGSRAFS